MWYELTFPRKGLRKSRKPKIFLTKDELLEFLYACNTVSPFYYISVYWYAASEALALTWKDIN